MAIEFNCPACGQMLRVGDEHAGKVARCPQCQAETDVPWATQAAPPAPFTSQRPSARPAPSEEAARAFDLFAAPPAQRADSARPGSNPDAGSRDAGNPFNFSPSSPSNPYAPPQQSSYRKYAKEGRGQAIVILAAMSYAGCFACGPLGLIMAGAAWAMAQQDLSDIELGLIDPMTEGSVRLGRIVAMIHVILWGITMVAFMALVGLAIVLEGK